MTVVGGAWALGGRVLDKSRGSARTFGLDASVRFPTLRPEGATGSRSGSGKAGHDAERCLALL